MDEAPNKPQRPAMICIIQSKAALLLRLGPARYRRAEGLDQPAEELEPCDLEIVRRGCEQIVGGRGFSEELHLCGLGISGFYVLMRLLGFTMLQQAAYHHGSSFLDRILFQHRVTGDLVTMYNVVPKSF